ncbi:MAG: NifU family protein [Myxococcales bacterium]|nr:NifU family protein [Myxococcales bacterium]
MRNSGERPSDVLQFDEAATRKLNEMKEAGRFDDSAIRVAVEEEGASFLYQLEVVKTDSRVEEDDLVLCNGIPFYIDLASAQKLAGATLEYVDAIDGGGFRFENPNQPRLLANPLAARVQQVLDDKINPEVASHGGRVSLMDVQETRVFVRLGGGCQGCGMAAVTLRQGVTTTLMSALPEITEVLDITDHDAGENPYYSS